MNLNYGFFIIEARSCNKKQKLIKYLAEIIHLDNQCILCSKNPNKSKKTEDSNQQKQCKAT
jgi:hypothetical protein